MKTKTTMEEDSVWAAIIHGDEVLDSSLITMPRMSWVNYSMHTCLSAYGRTPALLNSGQDPKHLENEE